MGLSCYEQNAEVIQDSLMSTEEDDDFKAGLIALSSIVAGLQNPPKSDEERNDSTVGKKGKVSLPDGEHNISSPKLPPCKGCVRLGSVCGSLEYEQYCISCKRIWQDNYRAETSGS